MKTISMIHLYKKLINNHDIDANKGKLRGHLALEPIFSFCRALKNITENLGFHLTFKTDDLQDIIFTTLAADIIITIDNLNLYVPFLFNLLKH